MYFDKSSGPLIEINLSPHCFAAAAAKIVFPVPGKPYNSTPDCRRKGAFPNNFGNYKHKL